MFKPSKNSTKKQDSKKDIFILQTTSKINDLEGSFDKKNDISTLISQYIA